MTSLTLTLHQKTLRVQAESGTSTQKLSFRARLPNGCRLYSHNGDEVTSGYVEFVAQKPRYETEVIWFINGSKDIDTGAVEPPSVTFYALITAELFALIRDAHPSLSFEIRINTEFLGPLQFDDSQATAIKWDLSRQNPVPVQSYELIMTTH